LGLAVDDLRNIRSERLHELGDVGRGDHQLGVDVAHVNGYMVAATAGEDDVVTAGDIDGVGVGGARRRFAAGFGNRIVAVGGGRVVVAVPGSSSAPGAGDYGDVVVAAAG